MKTIYYNLICLLGIVYSGVFGFNQAYSQGMGIGIATPISQLHVYESTTNVNAVAGFTIEQASTGDAVLQYLLTGGQRWVTGIDNSDGDKFKISSAVDVGSTPRLSIQTTGEVGIGTATPVAKLDIAYGVTTVNTVVNATGSINDFLQYNIQNTSTGIQAQSGYSATADNGTSTTGFAWMGINNSAFNFPTAYNIGVANDVTFLGSGQDLYVANAHNTKSIIFSTGKAATPFFNERMRITNAGNVGIGATAPAGKLHLYETTGTTTSATAATLILEHGNSGGENGIIFKSNVNAGSDYGYIKYSDDGSGNGSTTENSLLEIGVQNDVPDIYQDDIAIMPSGYLGVNTRTPTAELHVKGYGATSATFTAKLENSSAAAGLYLVDDGRLYGTALHNNSGAVTGTTTQYIASGTYTPTLTNVSNIGSSTAYACQWIRVGNVVTVSGKVDINANLCFLCTFTCSLDLSLPIASNIAANENIGGTFYTATEDLGGEISGDSANDRCNFNYVQGSGNTNSFYFTFTYIVL